MVSALVGEGLQRARQHLAAGRGRRGARVAEDSRDWSRARRSRSRRARPAACVKRLVARRAGDNDLGQHRIVERRDLRAALDPGLDARILGPRDMRQQAGARAEVAAGIFGVEAHLDRCAPRLDARLIERRHLAGRLPHHPLDEIDAGDFFGDAVLDLEARVDLEEVELVGRQRRRELDGAGALVARPTGRAGTPSPRAPRASCPADSAPAFPR